MKNVIGFIGAFCASEVVTKAIKNNLTNNNVIEKVVNYIGTAVISGMVFASSSKYVENSVNEIEQFANDLKEGN